MTSVSRDGDVVTVGLEPDERTVLAGLALSLVELLTNGAEDGAADAVADPLAAMVGMTDGPVPAPDDPALRRLLPDAYADDAGAEEFRRLTDASLRQGKVAALSRIADDVTAARDGRVALPVGDVDTWLTGLNDLRLVLGVRLGVTEEPGDLDDIEADDPRAPLLWAYDWLTSIQGVLLELVVDES